MTSNGLKKTIAVMAACLLGGLISGTTFASGNTYEVKLTNLTKGMTFTPALVATTQTGSTFFSSGYPASSELETIAETGNSTPLRDSLDYHDSGDLDFIEPGQSDYVVVEASGTYKSITIASMLIPTNDTFIAVNGIELPKGNKSDPLVLYVNAYDAGTELNDELCISLPGPDCGPDAGPPSNNGEGYIYISGGIRGVGDVDADLRDFNNPVAKITITRIYGD